MDMNDKKVTIVSTVNANVGITYEPLNLKREWPKKGAKVRIKYDVLEEALSDPGIDYLFTTGILYIDDMEVKKELGLEPDDAEKPENIIVLTDEERDEVLKNPEKLAETIDTLSKEQKTELAEYAIENEVLNMGVNSIFKEKLGIDIIDAIRLRRSMKAEEKRTKE